jgi:hypothetical protein
MTANSIALIAARELPVEGFSMIGKNLSHYTWTRQWITGVILAPCDYTGERE